MTPETAESIPTGSDDAKLRWLRTVPGVAAEPDDVLEAISSEVCTCRVQAGERLESEPPVPFEAAMVIEGFGTVWVGEHPQGVLGPGAFLGEMDLFDQAGRPGVMVAETPMRLLLLPAAELERLVSRPGVTEGIAASVADHLARPVSRRAAQRARGAVGA